MKWGTLKEEKLHLEKEQEELARIVKEYQGTILDRCVSIAVTELKQLLPNSVKKWIEKSLTPCTLENIDKLYSISVETVTKKHRETVDPSMWTKFVELVEAECEENCKPQLDQVRESVSKFMETLDKTFAIEGICFLDESKLEEFASGEVAKICKDLEVIFVKPAVEVMCGELMKFYRLQNRRILRAERDYAKTISDHILAMFKQEMCLFTDPKGTYFFPRSVFNAASVALLDKSIQTFVNTFPVNNNKELEECGGGGLKEIQNETKDQLQERLQEVFVFYQKMNDEKVGNETAKKMEYIERMKVELEMETEKFRADVYSEDANGNCNGEVDILSLKWMHKHAHTTMKLKPLLGWEVDLRMAMTLEDGAQLEFPKWKNIQTELDKPMVFEKFHDKKKMQLEKRKKIMIPEVTKFFHQEMERLMKEEPFPPQSFLEKQTTVMDYCLRKFQTVVWAFYQGDGTEEMKNEYKVLKERFSEAFPAYQEENAKRYKEVRAEVSKIVNELISEYGEKLELFLKKNHKGVELKSLKQFQEETVNGLKRTMESEIQARCKREDPNYNWDFVQVYIDLRWESLMKSFSSTKCLET